MKFTSIMMLAMAVAVSSCNQPPPAQILEGQRAALRGDGQTAYRLLRPLADQGEAEAQFALGLLYYRGLGVTRDPAAAVSWYRKAADQGYAKAQFRLGCGFR